MVYEYVLSISQALAFSHYPFNQPFHVSDCESTPRFRTHHARNVVGNDHTIEFYFFQ